MLRRLSRPIKYGVVLLAAILATAIYFNGFSAVGLVAARGLLWIVVAGTATVLVLGLAATPLLWLSARSAARLSIDDPGFRSWLLEMLWLCREQGFLLSEGSTLGECEERLLARLRRDWGGIVSEVRQRPVFLLLYDEERVAAAPDSYTPRAAEEFVRALVRISRGALVIRSVQASATREIRLEIRSQESTEQLLWSSEDDGRLIAEALSRWLPEGRAFRSTMVNGRTYFAELDNTELARLERELGW